MAAKKAKDVGVSFETFALPPNPTDEQIADWHKKSFERASLEIALNLYSNLNAEMAKGNVSAMKLAANMLKLTSAASGVTINNQMAAQIDQRKLEAAVPMGVVMSFEQIARQLQEGRKQLTGGVDAQVSKPSVMPRGEIVDVVAVPAVSPEALAFEDDFVFTIEDEA